MRSKWILVLSTAMFICGAFLYFSSTWNEVYKWFGLGFAMVSVYRFGQIIIDK